jgi:hypothetical protein
MLAHQYFILIDGVIFSILCDRTPSSYEAEMHG